MKKIYHLENCSTCQRIIGQLHDLESFELHEIKSDRMTPEQVDEMKEMAGSYEAIFSKRAMKYRSLGLNEQELNEQDYRKWIIEEYTFLKRPVIIMDKEVFVGSSKKNITAAIERSKMTTA